MKRTNKPSWWHWVDWSAPPEPPKPRKRPPLSAEHRAKIGAAVREAAERHRARVAAALADEPR